MCTPKDPETATDMKSFSTLGQLEGVCTWLVQILVPLPLGVVAAACVCDPGRWVANMVLTGVAGGPVVTGLDLEMC